MAAVETRAHDGANIRTTEPPPRPGRIRKRLLEPDWPDLDRFLWEQAFTKGDMFAAAGAGAHLAAYTVFQLSCTYGTWLAHISRHCPEVLLAHPFHRVNPTRIRDFAEELSATNSTRSVASHLRKLRQVQLKFGTAEKLEWLSTLASRLQASGRARSKEGRVQTADELFKLGLLLMNQATEKWQVEHSVSRAAGRMYRDGLLIAILAIAPIRRRNIAALSLGDNLVLLGDEWHILFGADETKNGREYEIGLALLSKEIDRFLAVFRPAFHLSDKHSGFWPSTKRCPMTPNAIYDAICLGRPLTSGAGSILIYSAMARQPFGH